MGWLALLLMGIAAIGVALAAGLPRAALTLVGAALMLGAVGYALQGRPGLGGAAPQSRIAAAQPVDPALIDLRTRMFGRFTSSEPIFFAADALQRSGNPGSAVRLMLGAIAAQPQNAALWTGLGNAYAVHDGRVSPAARLAFGRAVGLAPQHPGPAFFYGIALVRAGEFREARAWWMRAFLLTPDRVSYRADINARLALIDAFLASPAGRDAA